MAFFLIKKITFIRRTTNSPSCLGKFTYFVYIRETCIKKKSKMSYASLKYFKLGTHVYG